MPKKQLTERLISIDKINEPDGVIRLEIENEAIKTLSDSINALGLLQAILVRPVKDRFEIIYGHRRFLACRLLGMPKIRTTVQELTDVQTAIARAAENVEREDISPIEEAAVYKDLVETHKLSYEKISGMMGKSASVIKRRLDLLKMPTCLQQAIHKKLIPYSVGEVLWQLKDQTDIEYYLAFAIENGASRSTVVQWVKDCLDKRRQRERTGEGGGGSSSPMESVPQYIACDTCQSAMEIGKETVLRICPGCSGLINDALKKAP